LGVHHGDVAGREGSDQRRALGVAAEVGDHYRPAARHDVGVRDHVPAVVERSTPSTPVAANLRACPHRCRRTSRAEGMLRIRRRSLPRHVNQVALEGLRVGDARIDLLFERIAQRLESVALTHVKVDGQLDVVLEISRSPSQVVRAGRRQSGSRPAAT
jgi:hypothetical protein